MMPLQKIENSHVLHFRMYSELGNTPGMLLIELLRDALSTQNTGFQEEIRPGRADRTAKEKVASSGGPSIYGLIRTTHYTI